MEDMHAFFRSRRLLLAPMAGVSDEAFRTLCREQGADLTYTEMVSAKGLSYANEKTRHLLRLAPGEDQVAVQLFGHEPDTMAAQAAWIEREMGQSLAYLDINMGCPARKIVSKGDGSALMRDPELAGRVIREAGAVLGEAIAMWADLLDPEFVVLSGSVCNAGPLWRAALHEGFERQAPPIMHGLPIVDAALGGRAPLIGAAEYLLDSLKG